MIRPRGKQCKEKNGMLGERYGHGIFGNGKHSKRKWTREPEKPWECRLLRPATEIRGTNGGTGVKPCTLEEVLLDSSGYGIWTLQDWLYGRPGRRKAGEPRQGAKVGGGKVGVREHLPSWDPGCSFNRGLLSGLFSAKGWSVPFGISKSVPHPQVLR